MSSSAKFQRETAVFGALVLLAILFVAFGLFELSRTTRVRTEWIEATTRYDAGQSRLRALSTGLESTDRTIADLQKEIQRRHAQAATAATPASTRPPPESRTDWENLQKLYPEVREMLAQVHKLQIERYMAPFYKMANLTQAQIDEFEARSIELFDQTEAMAPGPRFNPQTSGLTDDQMLQLLGEQAYQQFLDFKRMRPATGIASNIVLNTGYAGVPISSEQAQQLAQIVAKNDPNYQAGKNIDVRETDFTAAAAEAQKIMSPEQWKASEDVFLNYQYRVALMHAQETLSASQPAQAER